MDNLLKIKLSYKKNYSYGAYFAGFDLFDSIYVENETDLAYSALKLQITSTPNILLSAEKQIDFLPAGGYRFLSGDFICTDVSLLASEKKILDVSIGVSVRTEEGKLLASKDFSCRILPYFYFSGIGDMPETAAFFVTPNQEELDRIEVAGSASDPVDFSHQIYENIKALRITYSPEDYSGTVPLPVRLCERVVKERFANSFELSLLYASALERGGLSPVIVFAGRGKVYGGFSVRTGDEPLFISSSKNDRNLDGLYLIDGNDLAFGSSLPFDTALFQAKNSLQLGDDKILILNIAKARRCHLSPLPPRISEKGSYVLSHGTEEDKNHNFSDYDQLWKDFSEDDRVKSILLGGHLAACGKKMSIPFQADLDVNQNKILSKILSNDFTLIRAHTGVGISTLFSRACAMKLKGKRNVLYITDPDYHPDDFAAISSDQFDSGFVWNLLKDGNRTCYKDEFQGIFSVDESIFDDRNQMQSCIEKLDFYYSNLEGDKSIVSSFLVAADRYDQLQDASDAIIFSPEQVGTLSDDMVENWFSTVNDIVKSVNDIGSVHENPLLLVRNKNFSYEYKSKLIRHLEDFLHCVESIMLTRDQILPMFSSLERLSAFSELTSFCDLYRLFSDFQNIPEQFFEHAQEAEINFRKATRLIQAKEENDTILQTIKVSFHENVLELDAFDLYTRYSALAGDKSFKAISQKHGILKSVKRFLKPNCDVENIEYILSRLYTYQKNCRLIEEEKSHVFSLFSVSEIDEDSSWKKLPISADLCYQCFAVYQSTFDLQNLSGFVSDYIKSFSFPGVNEKVALLRDRCDEFSVLKKDLERLVFNEIDFFYPHASGEDYFTQLYQKLSDVLSASDHLKNWCNWLSVKEKAIACGLKNIIVSVENGKITNEEIKRGFLRAFFKAVCEYNFISHPDLIPENFSISKCQREYKAAFSACKKKGKCELDSVLSVNRFDSLREIETSSFAATDLISNKKVFSTIFPCVISDWKQAKKYFSHQRNLFDLILIESRKAVPLEDLIWLFYSGKQVAFAGSFSNSHCARDLSFDLSTPAFDYLWKICDEKYSLSASYFSNPQLTGLKNSYFSNLRSDTRYYTVPSPCVSAVAEWRVLPGSYGGEYPGANLYEAQNAVEELISFAMTESKKSIGVIAATIEQKKLILRLFAQKLRHQEELTQCFSDYSRFYITSLGETLYPCDYIVFSASFSADRSTPGSRLPDAFWEFGGEDPIKAIGAMLSCAKEKLLVLSSFRLEELASSPTLLSVNSAFSFLFNALSTPSVHNSFRICGIGDEIGIIKRLRTELESRGYKTVSGLQSGRYYIDLAVLNDDGDFSLGILSDHSVLNQHSNIAAIEIANADYYETCGWQIYRLRAACCFDSFENELQRILQILQSEGSDFPLI